MKNFQRLLYWFCTPCQPNKSRTVRYAFPLAIVSLAILAAAAVTSETSSYIKLSTNTTDVVAGEFFTIDVYVGAHVEVNAVDISVTFPEDQIEIKGIDTGESVITIWTEEPSVSGNTVSLSGGTFRRGFLGEHLVAQINAQAKTNGSAKFSVDSARILAGDGQGTEVTVSNTGEESLTMYVALQDTVGGAAGSDTKTSINGTVSVGIYTDINGDGKVDMNDIVSFMGAWMDKKQTYDFNSDGRMTFVDFAIILAYSFFN